MSIQKQIVPISFAGGVDTKTDKLQVLSGKLLSLQNGIFLNAGAVNKRWGYRGFSRNILGSSPMISSCYALHSFNSELLLFDGLSAYSYSPTRDAWLNRGGVVSTILTNQEIVRNSNQQLSPDFAFLNGVEVYAWEDSRGGIRYSVVDAVSGSYLLIDQPLYAGMLSTVYKPKCLALGAVIYVFFVNQLNQLCYVTINPQNPTAVNTTSVTIINGLAAPTGLYLGGCFDACVSGSQVFLAYYTGSVVGLSAVATTGQVAWTKTFGSLPIQAPSFPTISVAGDASGNAWVTFGSLVPTTQASTTVYSSSGTQLLAPTLVVDTSGAALIQSMGAVVNGTTLQLFAELVTTPHTIIKQTVSLTGTLGTPANTLQTFVRGVGLASKPFTYNSSVYVNVAFASNLQSTYFTLDSGGNVIAKVNPGLGGGLIKDSDYTLPECAQVSTGVFKFTNLVKGLPNTEAGQVLALLGVNATKLDFFDPNHFLSSAINGGFYTVGGILQSYDGAKYVESGFHIYPEGINLSPVSSGGQLGTGTYNYCVTYEWPDNQGLTQISTPSVAQSVTFGSGTTNSVQLQIPTLTLTKKSNVRIVVYRTPANGILLTRVTSALVPLYNDPTVSSVFFTDTLSDASIASNGAMYTQPLVQGGNPILQNDAPPACSLITTYADRIFLGGLDDKYLLWYSKQSAQNVPMEFSAAQTLRIDPDGGGITGLARMDEKLVIFKKAGIFYLIGQGPTATGDQNDFQDPIAIPTGSVGCVNQNGIVLTPMGLMFPSQNGIYLLDRNLNVSYKGAPVEAFNALTITSATLIPNQWVVFTTSSGTALVYDYYFDQWSTFTNHQAVDSVLYLGDSNLFAWASPNGQVFEQTPTSFTDNGTPIPFSLTTSWINPGVIQGYMRVYHALILGTYKGTHNLTVWSGFDYDEPFTSNSVIPVNSVLGVSTFGSASPFGSDTPFGGVSPGQSVYQFRLDVLRKCQSIRFQISDQQTAPGNEGLSLSALSLVVGVKTGANKVALIKQFGVA